MTFDELLASGWVQLDAIAGRFDVPIEGRSREQRAVLALVLHARHVYHAILRDCAAGDIATALLSLRALSEAGVLIHWIELSPVDHVEMWEAEADRHRLAAEKAFDAMDRKRGWDRFRAPVSDARSAERAERVRQVREAARLRGERLDRAACLPTVEHMAGTTVEAMRQIYVIVYRITSPWAHASEQVLSAYGPEVRSDGTHIVPAWAWSVRDGRSQGRWSSTRLGLPASWRSVDWSERGTAGLPKTRQSGSQGGVLGASVLTGEGDELPDASRLYSGSHAAVATHSTECLLERLPGEPEALGPNCARNYHERLSLTFGHLARHRLAHRVIPPECAEAFTPEQTTKARPFLSGQGGVGVQRTEQPIDQLGVRLGEARPCSLPLKGVPES